MVRSGVVVVKGEGHQRWSWECQEIRRAGLSQPGFSAPRQGYHVNWRFILYILHEPQHSYFLVCPQAIPCFFLYDLAAGQKEVDEILSSKSWPLNLPSRPLSDCGTHIW